MKKFTIYGLIALSILSFFPQNSRAGIESNLNTSLANHKLEPAEANVLIARLEEIKAIDKTNMTRVEKKALRKEVRAIKANLADGGGVYLSVGAIIIIILLLILLL